MRMRTTLGGLRGGYRTSSIVVMSTIASFAVLVSEASALSVFAVGNKRPGLEGELYRFNENGPMEQRWDIPDTRFGLSLATDGTSLFVGEYGRAINRYDLNGNFLGQFADVSGLAGPSPSSPKVETDLAGSVYTSFGGLSSQPRTSFRLDPAGTISQAFSHQDLVFPRGIDAAANGDVYIVNSAAVGVGNRLFKFNSAGQYLGDFPITPESNPSDLAINEANGELYLADEFGDAIHVYDIASGSSDVRRHPFSAGRRARCVYRTDVREDLWHVLHQ